MPDERPISEKKYGINKHRFLELKHHCLQYQDWRRELVNMQDTVKAIQYGKEGKGSLGHSSSELEGMKIAGNTFDYPFIHGKAIQATGKYSFVSCSDEAVENGIVTLEDYPIVDYILGLEKEDASTKAYYKTFSSAMQRIISSYCQSGGNILVSGAYVGSDMNGTQGNREFTQRVLKYGYQGSLTDRLWFFKSTVL